jgi:RHS repeat-associated protein
MFRLDPILHSQRYNYLNGGVKQIYTRDSLNRMSRLDVKKGATPLSAEVYTYDRMSRLTGVNRWPESKQDLFGYYLDGEMYWAQYGVTGPPMPEEAGDPDQDMPDTTDPWSGWTGDPEAEGVPPPEDQGEPPPPPPPALELPAARTVAYSYDRAGNRVGMNDDGNPIWYTTNLLNQYTGVTGAAVTNGNEHEISDYQGVHFTYRNDERLISASSGGNNYSLAYDALGRCVKRTLNNVTTYYIYDGEKAIIEYNSAGTLVGRNLYGKGIDENLHRAYGAQTYYFQQDHEGTVTHLTSATGTIVEQYKYDAFGAVTVYNGAGGQIPSTAYNNRFLFTGREYAATFGFYEYRARAYNPTLGRFMSEDPKGFDAGDYNLFRYVGNDPLDRVDPMGLEGITKEQFLINGNDQATGPAQSGANQPKEPKRAEGSGTPNADQVDRRAKASAGQTKKEGSPMDQAAAAARDPKVAAALDKAWKESNPNAPNVPADKPGSRKTEQGGWAVKDSKGYIIIRVPAGTRDSLPRIVDPRPKGDVVFWFHTHPNTEAEGYKPNASSPDINFTRAAQVPGLIKTHSGDIWIPYP